MTLSLREMIASLEIGTYLHHPSKRTRKSGEGSLSMTGRFLESILCLHVPRGTCHLGGGHRTAITIYALHLLHSRA